MHAKDALEAPWVHERLLVEAAGPFLDALSIWAGHVRHAVLLTDGQGLLVAARGSLGAKPGRDGTLVPWERLKDRFVSREAMADLLRGQEPIHCVVPESAPGARDGARVAIGAIRRGDGDAMGLVLLVLAGAEEGLQLRPVFRCAIRGIESSIVHEELRTRRPKRELVNVSHADLLEGLRQDLVQIHATTELRFRHAARLAQDGKTGELEKALQHAESMTSEFSRRAELWRFLSTDEVGQSGPIGIHDELELLCRLLTTETRIRSVRIRRRPGPEVFIDCTRGTLHRCCLRAILEMLKPREATGLIVISVLPDVRERSVCLSFGRHSPPSVVGIAAAYREVRLHLPLADVPAPDLRPADGLELRGQ